MSDPAPNEAMVQQQLDDLITLVNSKTDVKHGPFTLFIQSPGQALNDRGAWSAGTYNTADKVTNGGYTFVASDDGVTLPPLDGTTGNPNAGWGQLWQDCCKRMRAEINAAANSGPSAGITLIPTWKQAVSGPWPCENPSLNYDELAFYFADTGHGATVTVGGSGSGVAQGSLLQISETESMVDFNVPIGDGGDGSAGPYLLPSDTDDETDSDGNGTVAFTARTGPTGQYRFRFVSEAKYEVVIGGTRTVPINVTFTVQGYRCTGATWSYFATPSPGPDDAIISSSTSTDATNPDTLVDIDTSDWFSGATWAGDGNGTFTCTVNATVAPGRYGVTFTLNRDPNNRASGTLTLTTTGAPDASVTAASGSETWTIDTFVAFPYQMSFAGSMGYDYSSAEEVPGIHDSKTVYKIPLSSFGGIAPPTILGVFEFYLKSLNGDDSIFSEGFPLSSGDFEGIRQIDESDPSLSDLDFYFEKIYLAFGGGTFSETTDGFWFGKTPPITSLGIRPWIDMPWNKFPVTVLGEAAINSYLGYIHPYKFGTFITGSGAARAYDSTDGVLDDVPASNAVELLPWPKRWKAAVHYPHGFTIQDSNGNLQVVQVAGRSNNSEPTWPTIANAITTEPIYVGTHNEAGVVWRLQKVLRRPPDIRRSAVYAVGETHIDDNFNSVQVFIGGTTGLVAPTWPTTFDGTVVDGTVTWKLIRFNHKIAPAYARFTPPIYPCFWQNPPAGRVDVPPVLTNPTVDGSGHHIYDFAPQGWWIYRVALNRIPQTKSTEKPSGTVSVKLGCVRSGSFVEFGTYDTGQIIDAMWPIFTNAALCYQCSERVDVQAEIITCGTDYNTWGAVDYPMAAAYLNDLTSILDLLS